MQVLRPRWGNQNGYKKPEDGLGHTRPLIPTYSREISLS